MDFQNKNILLIIHAGSLGGAERQGLGLGKILTEQYDCKVYLLLTFSRETTKEFENFAEKCHIKKIFHFGQSYLEFRQEFTYKNLKRLVWSGKYLLRMRKGLKAYEFDFIFPFLNFPSKVAFYLYKLLPTVKFTFWHQLGLDIFTKDIFENIAARNIPCVIANSSTGLELFRECYPLKESKAFILPQYISMDYVKLRMTSVKKKYGIDESSVVIGMIAHYRSDKHHELLLDVFDKLNNEYKEVYLVFLGNKDNTRSTEKKYNDLSFKIREKNLNHKVSLLSQVQVEEVLNILDIGVLVSRIEGMPNSVMEYMLYSLPVVASNHPGCRELLKDSSFLIENNETELYTALEKLVLSNDLRKVEGDKNSEYIKAYTKESYIDELHKIIQKVI